MSAKVETQHPETVSVEIDGETFQAPKGATIIAVADEHGIDIPRFCYHSKLSAPANCRMCLVDVEMGGRPAPKPLPACITAVADGMVVRTASERALKAQKGVMEFLLINHPLDCPICDQGGECELQDLALGYGRSVSRFVEGKRVVKDENLGPLIATEMTRCIHCTRCVRFLDEIAGTSELGAMHRGEHTEISTLVGHGVHSELSGNIIDLCPVGALTSRPYRYRARAWEMLSHPSVAPHDCLGSNIHLHQVRGTVKRVVPRDNEAVNECWISDRDRFSYEGIYSEERLTEPQIRRNGEWQTVDWQTALEAAANGLRDVVRDHGGDALGALISPSATLEEMYLLSRLVRELGSDHIDHRLRQGDFRDGAPADGFPGLGLPVAELERLDAALLIGAYPRHEQPLLNHRLRKAARRGGAVMAVNPRGFDWNFDLAVEQVADAATLPRELALVATALAAEQGVAVPEGLGTWAGRARPKAAHEAIARALARGERGAVLLGALAEAHPAGAELRALAGCIAELAGARYGRLTDGANSAGGWLAGALPERRPDGSAGQGLDARAMLEQPRRGYLLLSVEPEHDTWDGATALAALAAADTVVALTAWDGPGLREHADVLLPIGTLGETAGTFVNAEGRWQTFAGVARPLGEARPAWRVLRVLANVLEVAGFEYQAPDEIHHAVRSVAGEAGVAAAPDWAARPTPVKLEGPLRIGAPAMFNVDGLTRRAASLQRTAHAGEAAVHVSAKVAGELGIGDGEPVLVLQAGRERRLPLRIDDAVPAGSCWIAAGLPGSEGLGPLVGEVTLQRA
ncbi:NADH-quinone oxidoreductase subunit NuoG [Sediminicurvatus halobius]|uniref:NADH-quinone oxidoreductase n=1 Tax=Sediminicurvatus halobius TaxID=2182432 RepID=A0A2U2N536_9GAMM|nr:NADH-quinone oxidoreductase subunit NuoG [Spiribacter halobius]PWG64089.1 NADH-quinone oxidoreductase subunit G [Spiribacter halobius]UEX76857.1 NADH-quinone oxidoreductase subunit NuoG [Spiribacter halobius]